MRALVVAPQLCFSPRGTPFSVCMQSLDGDVCILVEPEPEALAHGIPREIREGSSHVSNARSPYERAQSRRLYQARVRLLELVP